MYELTFYFMCTHGNLGKNKSLSQIILCDQLQRASHHHRLLSWAEGGFTHRSPGEYTGCASRTNGTPTVAGVGDVFRLTTRTDLRALWEVT